MPDRRGNGVKQGALFFFGTNKEKEKEIEFQRKKRKRKRIKKRLPGWARRTESQRSRAGAFSGIQKKKKKKKNFVKKKENKGFKRGCLDERGGRSQRGLAHGLRRRA
jgi:hypothetical protein